jgi:DNA-binding CsgD family transcriptional regulator
MSDLFDEYGRLLSMQVFDENESDRATMDTRHRRVLTQLAGVSNSVVTVFDMYARKHVFTSPNFFDFFGRHADIEKMFEKVHPEDAELLLRHAVLAIKYAYSHRENMMKYKFITEYRIRNAFNEYVRVIEQQSVLETDRAGNAWLALSVIDMSPDQSVFKPVTSVIRNVGDHILLSVHELCNVRKTVLSPRETEILQFIEQGLLSKEISERLRISVHTVNTHRQRILEKLNDNYSMEAVRFASALGLLE